VKKTLTSLILGAALLGPCGSALAETPQPAEPRWGIRPEKSAPVFLDFARWLSERLGRVALPAETEPTPVTVPVSSPVPGPSPNIVCLPRQHCPIG